MKRRWAQRGGAEEDKLKAEMREDTRLQDTRHKKRGRRNAEARRAVAAVIGRRLANAWGAVAAVTGRRLANAWGAVAAVTGRRRLSGGWHTHPACLVPHPAEQSLPMIDHAMPHMLTKRPSLSIST